MVVVVFMLGAARRPELLKLFGITAPKDPYYKKPIPPLKVTLPGPSKPKI